MDEIVDENIGVAYLTSHEVMSLLVEVLMAEVTKN
jgi:hypothetical protein